MCYSTGANPTSECSRTGSGWYDNALIMSQHAFVAINLPYTLGDGNQSLVKDYTFEVMVKPKTSTMVIAGVTFSGLSTTSMQQLAIVKKGSTITTYINGVASSTTGTLPSTISDGVTIVGQSSLYSVRSYKVALTTAELDNNRSRDVTRYGDVSKLANRENFVTKGLISWLDGYYHTPNISRDSKVFLISINTNSFIIGTDGELIGGLNLDKSCYIFASSYNSAYGFNCASANANKFVAGQELKYTVSGPNGTYTVVDGKFQIGSETYTLDTNYVIDSAGRKTPLYISDDNVLSFMFGTANYTVSFGMIRDLALPSTDGEYTLVVRLEDNAGNITTYRYYKEFITDTTAPYVTGIEVLTESNNNDSTTHIWNKYNQSDNPYDYYSIGGKIIIMVSYSEAIRSTDKLNAPTLRFTSGTLVVDRELTESIVFGTSIVYTYIIKDNTPTKERDRVGDDGIVSILYAPNAEVRDIALNPTENANLVTLDFDDDYTMDYTVGSSSKSALTVNTAYLNINATPPVALATHYGHMPYAMIAKPFIESIKIEGAIIQTDNNMTYYLFNAGLNRDAKITITFNKLVNTPNGEFKLPIAASSANGDKEFEFVCAGIGTNSATKKIECTY